MDKKLQENMPIYVQIMNRVREAVAAVDNENVYSIALS